MNREDIIRMALAAGFIYRKESCPLSGESRFDEEICVGEYPLGEILKRFADCLVADHVELMNENQRLKRENFILRSEFKIWLVDNNVENYDMSEDAADEDAEKWLTHLIALAKGKT